MLPPFVQQYLNGSEKDDNSETPKKSTVSWKSSSRVMLTLTHGYVNICWAHLGARPKLHCRAWAKDSESSWESARSHGVDADWLNLFEEERGSWSSKDKEPPACQEIWSKGQLLTQQDNWTPIFDLTNLDFLTRIVLWLMKKVASHIHVGEYRFMSTNGMACSTSNLA